MYPVIAYWPMCKGGVIEQHVGIWHILSVIYLSQVVLYTDIWRRFPTALNANPVTLKVPLPGTVIHAGVSPKGLHAGKAFAGV